ncbi:MAG: FUSC family protein [Mycobacterium sp.]
MTLPSLLKRIDHYVRSYRAQLRFSLRVALAALLGFAIAQVLTIPLHGLWAVLTAVVVTQMSVGASIRATTEYVVGTLGGVICASAVAAAVPHSNTIALAGLLALTMVPLAFAAALNPSFRVAPFTGALVLLISGQLGEGPVEAALYRLLEVILGGAVAVMVSLLVLPERAHGLGLEASARILNQLAQALPKLLRGFTQELDINEIHQIQREIGQSITGFQSHAAESRGERVFSLVARPDPGPLARTLLRLRHDFVMVGRAAAAQLPDNLLHRLHPLLESIAASASNYLHGSATALAVRGSAPSLDEFESALEAYTSEITLLRNEGVMRSLSSSELERIFALGFALEQLEQNFSDLQRCVRENARHS